MCVCVILVPGYLDMEPGIALCVQHTDKYVEVLINIPITGDRAKVRESHRLAHPAIYRRVTGIVM